MIDYLLVTTYDHGGRTPAGWDGPAELGSGVRIERVDPDQAERLLRATALRGEDWAPTRQDHVVHAYVRTVWEEGEGGAPEDLYHWDAGGRLYQCVQLSRLVRDNATSTEHAVQRVIRVDSSETLVPFDGFDSHVAYRLYPEQPGWLDADEAAELATLASAYWDGPRLSDRLGKALRHIESVTRERYLEAALPLVVGGLESLVKIGWQNMTAQFGHAVSAVRDSGALDRAGLLGRGGMPPGGGPRGVIRTFPDTSGGSCSRSSCSPRRVSPRGRKARSAASASVQRRTRPRPGWSSPIAARSSRRLAQQPVAAAELLHAAARRAGDPRVSVDATSDAIVLADRVRVGQALDNLLSNARRYAQQQILLTISASTDHVALHVLDDGPGFPAAFLPSAFERFARADSGRTQDGTGLGLAIVAAIADAHGGSSGAANRSDGGADVWIELRTAPPRPAADRSDHDRRAWPRFLAHAEADDWR